MTKYGNNTIHEKNKINNSQLILKLLVEEKRTKIKMWEKKKKRRIIEIIRDWKKR